ncbi:MAG: hypothetical protein J5703_04475 [Methanomicrobium sp.]|nr:hypothetical protein [Methanomicrobium sp.]
MNDIYEFTGAALPWIAIALMLAVFFARCAALKKNGDGEYDSESMSLGMCFGVALSAALNINVGLGMVAGMMLGLIAGSVIAKKSAA